MVFSKIKFIVLCSLFFFSTGHGLGGHGPEDPFLWKYDAPSEVKPGGEFSVEITFGIPPGHFLYRDKTKLELTSGEGISLEAVETSPSTRKRDPFFGKLMDVYEGGATLRARFQVAPTLAAGEREVGLLLSYQGCSESLCYREMRRPIPIRLTVAASAPAPTRTFWWYLLLAFGGGILTDLTPCVLPIIPVTLAFIGVRREKKLHNIGLTLVLIMAMAFTYAALGVAGASLGKSVGFLFQGFVFSSLVALLYLVFALALFGWIPFQAPLWVRNRLARWGGQGVTGSALAGVTVGFLAAPCVGPVLASLLLYVTATGSLVKGFFLLFSFGLGMGSLFLVIGSFYHLLVGKRWGGGFTLWAKRVLAILLLLPAGYYSLVAYRQLRISQAFKPQPAGYWLTDPAAAFTKAEAEKKPVFVDFSASWCLPCLEMERRTFNQPEVEKFLSENFVSLKVDCTVETPVCREMIRRYQVVGWPTYLVLDAQGKVQAAVVGKIFGPEEFISFLTHTKGT